jgi:drug/metabolite transporter (DMT)-like permease
MRILTKNSVLLGVALMSLASSPIFIRLAESKLEFIGFWRLFATFTLLLLWDNLFKKLSKKTLGYRSFWQNIKMSFWGGVFFFFHLWTYIYAAQTTKVANLVLIFSLNPIFTATLSKVLNSQALPKGFWLTYGLSVLGLAILFEDHLVELFREFLQRGTSRVWIHSHEEKNPFSLGDLVALSSGLLHSLYLLSASHTRKKLSNLDFSVVFYLIGALGFFFVGLAKGIYFFDFNYRVFLCLVGMIIFPTLLGHLVITYLAKAENVTQIALAKLIEPPFSVFLAFLFLSEDLRLSAVLSFGCIALALLTLSKVRKSY